jgi:hypothetical protein
LTNWSNGFCAGTCRTVRRRPPCSRLASSPV